VTIARGVEDLRRLSGHRMDRTPTGTKNRAVTGCHWIKENQVLGLMLVKYYDTGGGEARRVALREKKRNKGKKEQKYKLGWQGGEQMRYGRGVLIAKPSRKSTRLGEMRRGGLLGISSPSTGASLASSIDWIEGEKRQRSCWASMQEFWAWS